jgi:hypothetical protein
MKLVECGKMRLRTSTAGAGPVKAAVGILAVTLLV